VTSVDQKKILKAFVHGKHGKHGSRTQNKNFDFSGFEFFRDFRAFRGPEKGFPGILVLKSSISNRGISCQEKQL